MALEAQDWGRVYDLALPKQLEKGGIGREQFLTLMDALCSDLPPSYLQGVRMETAGGKVEDYSRGTHGVLLVFPNAPKVEGEPAAHFLHALRDTQGWHVAVNEIPFRVSAMHGGSRRDQMARLARAMRAAKVERYWITVDGPVLETERLERYLRGELSEDQLYTGS